jgi:protocatechuate 3,4-dioxygenase beta subunit
MEFFMTNRIAQASHTTDHEHSGLEADLAQLRILNRRRALGVLGLASTTAMLAACGGGSAQASTGGAVGSATPTPTPTPTPTSTGTAPGGTSNCVAYATETNGPYPADGTNQSSGPISNVITQSDFQRSDIRTSVDGAGEAEGVQLTFTITLVDVNNDCAALEGYAIYIWHCDADGRYSLYDLPNEDFLRGIQTTDANGQVTFTTIVPGTYYGRYPHIHFEVFTSIGNATTGRYAQLISQFAVPKDVLNTIYAQDSTYASSVNALNAATLSGDNVFGDNSSEQLTAMTVAMSGSVADGYTASATVGIAT